MDLIGWLFTIVVLGGFLYYAGFALAMLVDAIRRFCYSKINQRRAAWDMMWDAYLLSDSPAVRSAFLDLLERRAPDAERKRIVEKERLVHHV